MKKSNKLSKILWFLPAVLLTFGAVHLVAQVQGEMAWAEDDISLGAMPDPQKAEPADDVIRDYYHTGEVKSVFRMKEGVKSGSAFHFYLSGDLRKVETFDQGMRQGSFATFYDGGGLHTKGAMSLGRIHGEVRYFLPDRSLKYVEYFENGSSVGRQYH